MDLKQLKEIVKAEIEDLEKDWQGYNPDSALIPHPHFQYFQGMLRAYRIVLASIERG